MPGQTANNPGLWEPETPGYGGTPTEKTVMATILELQELKPFDPVQRALAQAAVALAVSIDKGNAKGRAIANEVMQLAALLERLQGVDPDAADPSTLTPELRTLLDFFGTAPRPNEPSASYAA